MTVWPGDMMLPGQGQRADGGPERSPARRGPSALGAPEESTFLQETEGNRDSTAGGPPLRSPGRVPALSPWASNAILFGNPSVLVLDLCLERFCFALLCFENVDFSVSSQNTRPLSAPRNPSCSPGKRRPTVQKLRVSEGDFPGIWGPGHSVTWPNNWRLFEAGLSCLAKG